MGVSEARESPKWRGWELGFTTDAEPERWLDLQRHVGIVPPTEGAVETRIRATPHAIRCDWLIPRPDEGEFTLIVDPERAVLLDRRNKRTVVLPATRQAGDWSAERTGRVRRSPFGRAEEYVLAPAARDGSHVSLWLLPGSEAGRWLTPLWRTMLPLLAADGLPAGIPLEVRFEMSGDGVPDAVMRLDRLQRHAFDPPTFVPDPEYAEGFDRPVAAAPATVSEAAAPVDAPRRQAAQRAIVFQNQAQQEKAKLFVHSSVTIVASAP